MPCTPSEFCAVTAVSTLIPCTPRASIVLRSAWMPAPPPESEPAMVSTRAVGSAGAAVGGGRRPPDRHRAPPKWSQPAGPSQTLPSTSTWAVPPSSTARVRPITRQPSGTASAAGKEAASAWSSPPVSSSDVRVLAGRGGHRLQQLGHLEGGQSQVDRDSRRRRPGDRGRPAARRRRRSSRWRRRRRRRRPARTAPRAPAAPRPPPAASGSRAAARPARPRPSRSGPPGRRPGPARRRIAAPDAAVERSEHRHGDRDVAGSGHVAAHQH